MSIRQRVQHRRFTSTASEAWVSVVVAAEHLTLQSEEVFRRHGITSDRYNVLRILRGAQPGGLPRQEITGRLLRRAPDTTRLLDRLERDGLVRRSPGTEDARQSVARITPEGRDLLDRIDPELEDAMRTAMAPLNRDQLHQLAGLCDRLVP